MGKSIERECRDDNKEKKYSTTRLPRRGKIERENQRKQCSQPVLPGQLVQTTTDFWTRLRLHWQHLPQTTEHPGSLADA